MAPYGKEYEFHEINENPLILDFAACRRLDDVYLLLKRKFGLPKITGHNRNTLWDFLSDACMDEEALTVEIRNVPKNLQKYCEGIFEIFDETHKKYPNVTFQRYDGEENTIDTNELDYGFPAIIENPLILDFAECKPSYDVHSLLKRKFGLPDFYGENWDALWDLLWDVCCVYGPLEVVIKNFHSMPKKEQEYCKGMFDVFDNIHKNFPHITFKRLS